MFKNDSRRAIATAIIFSVHPKEKVLKYSSAGISPFYIFNNSKTRVETSGYPLGYKKNAAYRQEFRSLEKADTIIFATDGFTELYDSANPVSYMHDDATAVLIKLNQ